MSDDFETRYAQHKELCAKLNELNKAVLFDALVHAGVTIINVEFDGEGDSGQINGVSALAGDKPADLGESGARRTRFRDDSEQCSGMIPNRIPG